MEVGANTDATGDRIGQTDPLNEGIGLMLLGPILPPELTEDELRHILQVAVFAGRDGFGGGFDLLVVPEPSGLLLLVLGLSVLVRSRRFRA